jgi:hypothetical protein
MSIPDAEAGSSAFLALTDFIFVTPEATVLNVAFLLL